MKTFAYGALGMFVAMLAVGLAFQLGMAVERRSAADEVVQEQPPYVTTHDGRFAFVASQTSDLLWRINRTTGGTERIHAMDMNSIPATLVTPEGWEYTGDRRSYYSGYRYRRHQWSWRCLPRQHVPGSTTVAHAPQEAASVYRCPTAAIT